MQPGRALEVIAAVAAREASFEYRWQQAVHIGAVERKKFSARHELVASALSSFTALAEHGGTPADAIQCFTRLGSGWNLSWGARLKDERADVGVRLKGGRWSVWYERPSSNQTASLAFFRELTARLSLPLRVRGEHIFELGHTAGLWVDLGGLPQRVEWELPSDGAAKAIEFISEFGTA